MWGTFLSEPLSIEGQVGRYPACCLMERIPIPVLRIWRNSHAAFPRHRGLILISKGCPRDRGRLDTRYSPIRRSPSGVAETSPMLPLDLHVLSL